MSGIGRRTLITGTAAGAVPGLGRSNPSRFPYPGRPESGPGLGAGSGQTLRARRIIESGPGAGVFIYSGTPRLGNPPIEWTTGANVDPFGNVLPLQGTGSQISGTSWAVLNCGALNLALSGQPSSLSGSIVAAGNGWLNIISPKVSAPDTASVLELLSAQQTGTGAQFNFQNGAIQSSAGTAANPSSIATDSFISMALINNWANVAGFVPCRYRLIASPQSSVEIQGTLNAAAAAAVTFFTLPAEYRPATQQPVCSAGANAAVPAGLSPWIRCDAAGNLTVQNTGAIPAGFQLFFHGHIALTDT